MNLPTPKLKFICINPQEIPPYTIATAHQAGWIWDIGLQTRRGTGFVYSSKHLSHDQAQAKFEKYLGLSLDSVMTKRIPMNIGYREHFWKKNCGYSIPLKVCFLF